MQRCVAACLLVCLAVCGCAAAIIPRSCNKTILSVEDYAPTPIKVISLRCDAGGLTWTQPRNGHIVSFQKQRKPFFLCLHSEAPGATIHRLRGSARQFIAGQNDTGNFGCFESRCLHVAFLFQAGDGLNTDNQPVLQYTYYSARDLRCDICTELCEHRCLCSAPYVFIGKLVRFTYNEGRYTHYFRVAEFIRHNSQYINHTLQGLKQDCHSPQPRRHQSDNSTLLTASTMAAVPSSDQQSPTDATPLPYSIPPGSEVTASHVIPLEGEVKVYSKCPMKIHRIHLVSATFHVGRKKRGRMVLCCASDDSDYAQFYLEDLLARHECCRYL